MTDDERGKVTAALILSGALGLAVVLLAASVLVGVAKGNAPLAETSVRVLTTAFVLVAGILGYEQGARHGKGTGTGGKA